MLYPCWATEEITRVHQSDIPLTDRLSSSFPPTSIISLEKSREKQNCSYPVHGHPWLISHPSSIMTKERRTKLGSTSENPWHCLQTERERWWNFKIIWYKMMSGRCGGILFSAVDDALAAGDFPGCAGRMRVFRVRDSVTHSQNPREFSILARPTRNHQENANFAAPYKTINPSSTKMTIVPKRKIQL